MSNAIEIRAETPEDKHCGYVYPEGHENAGQQCKGMKGASGYCPPHARKLGLLPRLQPRAARAPAPGSSLGSSEELAAATAEAAETAQASLTANAAAWLAKPETQRKLAKRWDDILTNGSDAELIRLVKELTDRVEGRATEAKPVEDVTVPAELAELRRMTPEQRRAALIALG